jgi:hypothetical protein
MIQGYDLKTVMHLVRKALLPPGASISFHGTTPPDGWLLENGDTLGATGSGATQAGENYLALYNHLWNEIKNNSASYTISAAIGSTAAADWAANVTIAIPDSRAVVHKMLGNQTINTRTKVGPVNLGDKLEDQEQGHDHNLTENVFGTLVGNTFNSVFPAGNAAYNSAVKASTMISNGAHGTPRVGSETRDNSIGVNKIIKL